MDDVDDKDDDEGRLDTEEEQYDFNGGGGDMLLSLSGLESRWCWYWCCVVLAALEKLEPFVRSRRGVEADLRYPVDNSLLLLCSDVPLAVAVDVAVDVAEDDGRDFLDRRREDEEDEFECRISCELCVRPRLGRRLESPWRSSSSVL